LRTESERSVLFQERVAGAIRVSGASATAT
jgi:hypothetical protein